MARLGGHYGARDNRCNSNIINMVGYKILCMEPEIDLAFLPKKNKSPSPYLFVPKHKYDQDYQYKDNGTFYAHVSQEKYNDKFFAALRRTFLSREATG